MTVITISRQFSSGGDEIASRVCELLGYQQFDKHLIAQASQEAGLSNQEVIDYSEDNHKIRGFLDRLFGRPQAIATTRIWKEDPTGARSVEEFELMEDSAIALVKKAVLSAYQVGNLVIVGRGGQMILKDQQDVVHVRIEAPLEDRIQRLKQQRKQSDESHFATVDIRREVQDLIAQKDAASQDYIQRFYQANWSDPLLYHMVLNTAKLSIEQAVQIIVDLVNSKQAEQKHREQTLPAA